MNCKCGTKAFFFEKTTNQGTFNIFKCDTQETKKKVKCDFYYSQKIKDPVILDTKDTGTSLEIYKPSDPREAYIKDINKYICLLKNATHLPKEYSTNYIANINYILKRLNMKFYFEDTESIECLEERIKNNEYILSRLDTSSITFPLKLTEYPLELSVPIKTKCSKKRKKISKVEVQKLDLKSFIEEEERSKQEKSNEEEENDNKSDFSDESSEMSDEKDNTFDIDDYNSDVDETFDDAEAFSD